MSEHLYKRALLIGTEHYEHSDLGALPCTRADTAQLRQVLEHPAIGAFTSVRVVADPTAAEMSREIGDFLAGLGSADLALLYISGHGTRVLSSGEFFFLASDSDGSSAAGIENTGIGASFVNERLELCTAPQKVAVLDCCYSGGYSLGMRTRESKSSGRAPGLLNSRGVYVVSSSGPNEVSWGGEQSSSGPRPSAFTGEVVEALRTGRGDTDSDGVVSVEELFRYVNKQMRNRRFESDQFPTVSSDKVNTEIALARAYAGPPLEAAPVPSAEKATSGKGIPQAGVEEEAGRSWPVLLDYYRRCLQQGGTEMPLMGVDQSDEQYVCLTGAERLLSGDLDESGTLAVPDEAEHFVAQAVGDGEQLWCGYPAVVLRTSHDGAQYRTPHFAPLFIRRVELVSDGGGGVRLEPRGDVRPHPELVNQAVGEAAAAELVKGFATHWRAGMHSQLLKDVNHFLREKLQMREVEPLRPAELQSRIDTRTPAAGARNAAVLFSVKPPNTADKYLVDELDRISGDESGARRAALRPLLTGEAEDREEPAKWHRVAPWSLNERQEKILRSAMNRRLTVATGPPGTGKSQLVANVVATAVANGQSVLVASTNNRAVDEVWRRCSELVPGSLIRTGNREAREKERDGLQGLLKHSKPRTNAATVTAELALANEELDSARRQIDAKAEHEAELLPLSERRAELAEQLGHTRPDLPRQLGEHSDLGALARKADRAATAWWFGRWRRARFLSRKAGLTDVDPDPELCRLIGQWAGIEQQWRAQVDEVHSFADDTTQHAALDQAREALHERSHRMLAQRVTETARAGHEDIRALTQARGKDWSELRAVLRHVRGWAVTNQSARRFPRSPGLFDLVIIDEASQCSVPHVLPVLYRAKRALVIGDPMQLAPVTTLTAAREAQARQEAGVDGSWLEQQRRTFHRHSSFHAFRKLAGESLLLDEHFRCHPRIAAVSNDAFYGRALTVLTDVRRQRSTDRAPVEWVDVAGHARQQRGGSWSNEEEARQVGETVQALLNELPADADVGVITPFAAQAKLVQRWLGGSERVRVGTVHRFQGSECDAIVFSLVAAAGVKPGTLVWLNNQWNLWNVAITRARSHLVLVGDRETWREQGGVGRHLSEVAGDADKLSEDVDPTDDRMLMRLHRILASRRGNECSLSEEVSGHRADLLVRNAAGATAVLLDRGHDGTSPGRHLRLQYERCRLLADPQGNPAARRVPGWRVFDGENLDAGEAGGRILR
ncbi:caspase, EACC1-associated type [Salinifilum ghardaiensis]